MTTAAHTDPREIWRSGSESKKSVCAAAVEKTLPRSFTGIPKKRLPMAARMPPKRLPALLKELMDNGLDACENAGDVAVENGVVSAKSDAQDSRGRVAANTRERQDVFVVLGKYSVMFGNKLLCCLLQIARAAVIAEA